MSRCRRAKKEGKAEEQFILFVDKKKTQEIYLKSGLSDPCLTRDRHCSTDPTQLVIFNCSDPLWSLASLHT